jgi:hypothetical protein
MLPPDRIEIVDAVLGMGSCGVLRCVGRDETHRSRQSRRAPSTDGYVSQGATHGRRNELRDRLRRPSPACQPVGPVQRRVYQVNLASMLDNQVARDARDELGRRAQRPAVPTRWILERVIALLGAAAAFLALGALTQVLANHSHAASPSSYYYADAVVEALAYGLAAAAFFVAWAYAGRSSVLKEFSLPLMLAFLGAACITAQWFIVLLDYIEEFSLNPAYGPSIRHLVDVSAVLQLIGWGAVAAALAVTLRIFITAPVREMGATSSGLQWWHHGPTRAP